MTSGIIITTGSSNQTAARKQGIAHFATRGISSYDNPSLALAHLGNSLLDLRTQRTVSKYDIYGLTARQKVRCFVGFVASMTEVSVETSWCRAALYETRKH